MLATVLAIDWEPELRGTLTVVMAVAVLMGSIYLILGTNMGARLGFLVTFAALAGWMALMGGIWWMYGIGLKGEEPSWRQVEGRTVIQDTDSLYLAGVLPERVAVGDDATPDAQSGAVEGILLDDGWTRVGESAPEFGQAEASAGVFLEDEDALAVGDFDVTAVYEVGGEAYPKIFGLDELDQVAFWHKPYYTVVEVAPYVPLRDEPGRAPNAPTVDETQTRQYVYMIRDLGSLRQPAAIICISSTFVFLGLCWLLHRRDRFVAENLARKAAAVGA